MSDDGPKPGDQNVSLSGATFSRIEGKAKSTEANTPGKIMIGSKDEPSIFVEAQYNPKELEITKGVAVGEEVVTTGIDAVSDGAQVRAVRGVNPFTGKGLGKPAPSAQPSGK